MRNKIIASILACSSIAMVAVPVAAEAQGRRVLVCNRKSANTGTAVGAVAGGLLGNVVAAKGVKTEGTVLGAGVGAVVGHQVAKKNAKKNCHYVYR